MTSYTVLYILTADVILSRENYTLMKAVNQDQTIDIETLYGKGYTVASAARLLGLSTNHVWAVLRGKRRSNKVIHRLHALPFRPFQLRERIAR